MDSSSPSSRRYLLRALALAPAALAFAGAGAARAEGMCPVDPSEGLAESLHFVEMAENPDQSCRRCVFWTAQANGVCGACQMLQRAVPATGHCDSWTLR